MKNIPKNKLVVTASKFRLLTKIESKKFPRLTGDLGFMIKRIAIDITIISNPSETASIIFSLCQRLFLKYFHELGLSINDKINS